jgi:hypothetical protein
MIDPRELRIGNLLNHKGEWYPFQRVQTVEYRPIPTNYEYFEPIEPMAEFSINDVPAMHFEGIPLTEEWLLKFGFGKHHSKIEKDWFTLGDFILGQYDGKLIPSVYGESGLEGYGEGIQFVHQLQNLYFALTGKELELKKETV